MRKKSPRESAAVLSALDRRFEPDAYVMMSGGPHLLARVAHHGVRTLAHQQAQIARQLVALLQVQAASREAPTVSAWDLWLLPFVLAHEPAQVPGWIELFLHRVAQAGPLPNGQRPVSLTARDQPIGAFLQELLSRCGVPARPSVRR